MASIPVHSSSLDQIQSFIKRPSHALILQSVSSLSLQLATEHIITTLLAVSATNDNPAVLRIPKNSLSVSIEEIREIQKFVKLKTLGSKSIRRVICIYKSETMSTEAQNALLKILEEPPLDTILIVCTKKIDALLPTVRSRAQIIALKSPTRAQYIQMYPDHDSAEVEKAFLMSDGIPETLESILQDSTESTSIADMNQAKQILAASTYDKLLQVEVLSKNKSSAQVLKALENICYAAMNQAASRNAASTKQWAQRLKLILAAERDLTYNVSSKVVLTDLFMQISGQFVI